MERGKFIKDEIFRELLQEIEEEQNIDINILSELGGGYSSASLFLADITPNQGGDEKQLVVMKLDRFSKEKNEGVNHLQVQQSFYSEEYRQTHIAEMVYAPKQRKKRKRIVLFYKIAGESFINMTPLRSYSKIETISRTYNQVTKDFVKEWEEQKNYHEPSYGFEIVQSFFSYRFTLSKNNIEEFISEELGLSNNTGIITSGGLVLPNPLGYMLRSEPLEKERQLVLPRSPQHGDLNTGNIIIKHSEIPLGNIEYFLIDFFHYQENGCYLFDLLSIELSCILDFISRTTMLIDTVVENLPLLTNLTINSSTDIYPEILSIIQMIQEARRTLSSAKCQMNSYQDDWLGAYHLCGLSVGLVLANTKGLSSELRNISFMFAASHFYHYSKTFSLSSIEDAKTPKPIEPINSFQEAHNSLQNWSNLFHRCHNFHPDNLYIGAFGHLSQNNISSLSQIGKIPWSVLLDFDPETEREEHLYSCTKNQLEALRSVYLLQPQDLLTERVFRFERACYWYAVCGLSDSLQKSTLPDAKTWNRKYIGSLERLMQIISENSIQPVSIIIFWDNNLFIEDLIKVADKHLEDRVEFILASSSSNLQEKFLDLYGVTNMLMPFDDVLQGIEHTFRVPEINSPDKMIPVLKEGGTTEYGCVSNEKLQWIEEDCTVLHVNIGKNEEETESFSTESFLRGKKLSWFNLRMNVDIQRELTSELTKRVLEDLDKRNSTRISLSHNPGAGGTTVAYRTAWSFKNQYPSIVLHTFSTKTVDRIREIYRLSQLPILIISDSNDIAAAQVDNLYDQLKASQIPSVILKVLREFSEKYIKSTRTFFLSQQLNPDEALRFARTLSKEVPDKESALKELAGAFTLSRHRTPFYFCLLAFEKSFTGIRNFVKIRLENITENELKVLKILSIVHYFSHSNVPSDYFRGLFGLHDMTPLKKNMDLNSRS